MSEAEKIAERLTDHGRFPDDYRAYSRGNTMHEAAALIRAQAAEIERLREALKPFASSEAIDDPDMPDRCGVFARLGDLRRARAALNPKP